MKYQIYNKAMYKNIFLYTIYSFKYLYIKLLYYTSIKIK